MLWKKTQRMSFGSRERDEKEIKPINMQLKYFQIFYLKECDTI